MKKLLFVLVMVMSVVMLNAQTTKTTTPSSSTEKKSTTTTTTTAKTPASAAVSNAANEIANLPKVVSDNIEKAYPGYAVKEVKTEKNGEYKVMIEKGTSKETVYYDKEGKLVKKTEKKETKTTTTK